MQFPGVYPFSTPALRSNDSVVLLTQVRRCNLPRGNTVPLRGHRLQYLTPDQGDTGAYAVDAESGEAASDVGVALFWSHNMRLHVVAAQQWEFTSFKTTSGVVMPVGRSRSSPAVDTQGLAYVG